MSVEDHLTRLEKQLSLVLASADEAQRDCLCGPLLMSLYGELRCTVQTYVTQQRLNAVSIEAFVRHSVQHQFGQCTQTYTAMYAHVYEAMERAKNRKDVFGPLSGGGRNGIKQSSIPLDPQSALNVVECGDPASTIHITLHNDNEAVLKFPPSSLYRVPDIDKTVQSLENFYDKQCDVIHVDYLGRALGDVQQQYVEQDRLTVAIERLVQNDIAPTIQSLPSYNNSNSNSNENDNDNVSFSLSLLLDTTRQLLEPLLPLNLLLAEQRLNCQTYADNVHNKFMVAVQLKDNMLRPYNLTRLHQQTNAIGSIF